MKTKYFIAVLAICLCGCKQAKQADVDLDGTADVFIKGNKLTDADKSDNIFIIDGKVVNAVTNEHWVAENGDLAAIQDPSFKMTYNADTKEWEKEALN